MDPSINPLVIQHPSSNVDGEDANTTTNNGVFDTGDGSVGNIQSKPTSIAVPARTTTIVKKVFLDHVLLTLENLLFILSHILKVATYPFTETGSQLYSRD
jgi:hypothetical protein